MNMNPKVKSFLLLLISLLVGMLLGFLLKTKIIDYRFEQIRGLRKPDAMQNMMIEIIEPSEEQLNELKPILEKHQSKFASIMLESRVNAKILIDSLVHDISKVITEEQLERLHEHLPLMERDSGRRGPPFFKKELRP